MKRQMFLGLFIVLLLNIISNTPTVMANEASANQASPMKNHPHDGTLDLRDWDAKKEGVIPLDGEWEFYWEEFLEPKDFGQQTTSMNPSFVTVPNPWNTFHLENQMISNKGYATY